MKMLLSFLILALIPLISLSQSSERRLDKIKEASTHLKDYKSQETTGRSLQLGGLAITGGSSLILDPTENSAKIGIGIGLGVSLVGLITKIGSKNDLEKAANKLEEAGTYY